MVANIHLMPLREYNAPGRLLRLRHHMLYVMFGVDFKAMVPKAQTNQNQISHRKDSMEGVAFLNQVVCPVILHN